MTWSGEDSCGGAGTRNVNLRAQAPHFATSPQRRSHGRLQEQGVSYPILSESHLPALLCILTPPPVLPNRRSSTEARSNPSISISQPGHNRNQLTGNPRSPLYRQCQRLCLFSRGGRAHPSLVPGDDLQVPVHGGEHAAPWPGPAREDPGHQEDIGDGAVLEAAQGGMCPLKSIGGMWTNIDAVESRLRSRDEL